MAKKQKGHLETKHDKTCTSETPLSRNMNSQSQYNTFHTLANITKTNIHLPIKNTTLFPIDFHPRHKLTTADGIDPFSIYPT